MSPAPVLLCLCLSLTSPRGEPPRDRWFAEDKLKHLVTSFVVTSASASAARLAGLDARRSAWVGAGVGMGAGAWKELRDGGRPAGGVSVRDLAWDAAGVAAGTLVMRQVR